MALTESQKKANVEMNVPIWVSILQHYDVPDNLIPLIISQIILETGWFSSLAYKQDNNPGGITWNAFYTTRPGTSKGRPRKEGGNYVHFINLDVAAKDMIRILSKSPGNPLSAINPTDYAHKLKINGYYASSETDYARGLESINNRINDWADMASLLKKKNLTMAAINPFIILLIVGFIWYKK